MVGVTKRLDVALFTRRDSTRVADVREMVEALNEAEAFAEQAAATNC